MNTVAIVKALWIASVFATSALVSQALTESRSQAPMLLDEPAQTAPSDAGTQLPQGYAMGTGEMSIAWCSWDAAL
jgi:hypothetical protein